MTIDVALLAEWGTAVLTIVGVMTAFHRIIKKTVLERLDTLCEKVDDLKSWTNKQQLDLNNAAEGRQLTMKGTIIALKKLDNQELNGEVKSTIGELEGYLYQHSHKGYSYCNAPVFTK